VARHIDAYEHLRGAVLRAQARPEGLAAVTYHGVLGGLKVICATAVPASTPSRPWCGCWPTWSCSTSRR
jgi:hypothetical protein